MALLVAWTGVAMGAVQASDGTAAFGTIHGRVQNVVTGQYLYNARVAIKGTTLVDLTDESGTYRIAQVPAGAAVLHVFYTGLDPQELAVQIAGGGSIVQDVGLTNVALFGRTQEAVKLDP